MIIIQYYENDSIDIYSLQYFPRFKKKRKINLFWYKKLITEVNEGDAPIFWDNNPVAKVFIWRREMTFEDYEINIHEKQKSKWR